MTPETADSFVIAPPRTPSIAVAGGGRFPVRRIFCVGKNYLDHVREMGGDQKDTPPVFFMKPADALCEGGVMPYPPGTDDLHFEGELVVALKSGGTKLAAGDKTNLIYGYAAGCDLTRRDLQKAAKASGSPWDAAKALDHGAVIGPITPADRCGDLNEAALRLTVNGEVRQSAGLSQMIWSVGEIIDNLSCLFELKPGDLIYTGTPAGVGQIIAGDAVRVEIDGLAPVAFELA